MVVLGLSFVGLIGGALWAVTRPEVRAWLNTQLWRIPALGSRMKVYQLARLYRTSAMLLRAGIPAVRALDMVQGPAGGASASPPCAGARP